MSSTLTSPTFWKDEAKSYGLLKQDGSLNYILLDNKFELQPLVRNTNTTFTQFISSDARAKRCKVVVNGNFYDITFSAKFAVLRGRPDTPTDTIIQGQIVEGGKVVAGDSRPLSFSFGQIMTPTKDAWPWTFAAGKGDPPGGPTVPAAIGGVEPLIVNTLPFGSENRYKQGAPPKLPEPLRGEPPPESRAYLIQRSNAAFQSASALPPTTGKTILAYCTAKRTLLIAVQQHGAGPGQTHSAITDALAQQGFEVAVFLDGSDSATMFVDGSLVVTPGDRKNETIDVGVGFSL